MTTTAAREHPMPGQVLMHVDSLDDYTDNDTRQVTADLDAATVVTSTISGTYGNWHKPVLDLDLDAKLVPSTTPGHFHLYIDKAMTWDEYQRLLTVMVDVGLLEPGYLSASLGRGHTAVRLPWVRKTSVDTDISELTADIPAGF